MLPGGSQTNRDDVAYYQAETQMLTRENQMLKMRIRELGSSVAVPLLAACLRGAERQLNDGGSVTTSSPSNPSNLAAPP